MSLMTMPLEQESVHLSRQHQPSAHAVVAAISEALRQTGYGQLRRLDIHCDGDSITISGRVPTYYLKQFAQSTVMSIVGVESVSNAIQVVASSPDARENSAYEHSS